MENVLKKSYSVNLWVFCGTHEQKRSKFRSKTFKKFVRYKFLKMLRLHYGAMGYPLDVGGNEKK